jgi:hypothetical protein
MQELHSVLLFRLSPKWGMNPNKEKKRSKALDRKALIEGAF